MKRLNCAILSLLLSCCSLEPITIDHNYDEIKSSLISWDDIFNQEEDDYIVYFYSESCGHCKEIKNDVIELYLKSKKSMYFVCTNIKVVLGPTTNLIGINNIDDFYIFGTPFLTHIYQHSISEYYAGSNEVKSYISILNN